LPGAAQRYLIKTVPSFLVLRLNSEFSFQKFIVVVISMRFVVFFISDRATKLAVQPAFSFAVAAISEVAWWIFDQHIARAGPRTVFYNLILNEDLAAFRGRFEIGCQACSLSSSALASFRSSVSIPSLNQPFALVAPAPRHTHRRTQLPGFGSLLVEMAPFGSGTWTISKNARQIKDLKAPRGN
jgi:hypothetical protein